MLEPSGAVWGVDYRILNTWTPQTQSYIPTLDDILIRNSFKTGFGNQVCLAPRAKDLTTLVLLHLEKYRFKRLSFGLAPYKHFAQAYIDDDLVYLILGRNI